MNVNNAAMPKKDKADQVLRCFVGKHSWAYVGLDPFIILECSGCGKYHGIGRNGKYHRSGKI